jgi:hypothetical protein
VWCRCALRIGTGERANFEPCRVTSIFSLWASNSVPMPAVGHSGDLTSPPDPVIAEQDSSRDFVVIVCRFVFRILAGVFDLRIAD